MPNVAMVVVGVKVKMQSGLRERRRIKVLVVATRVTYDESTRL